jgi:hypothetical protein
MTRPNGRFLMFVKPFAAVALLTGLLLSTACGDGAVEQCVSACNHDNELCLVPEGARDCALICEAETWSLARSECTLAQTGCIAITIQGCEDK